MRFNRYRTLFWLSGFVIFLFSIIIVHYTTPLSNTSNTSISSSQSILGFQLGILSKIIKLSGAQDFVSLLITSIASRRHHHRKSHKEKCDKAKWASKLILDYNATTVFTVDLKGCANFTSVQKAIDAIPESSSNITRIIINSGTYRLIFFVFIIFSIFTTFISKYKTPLTKIQELKKVIFQLCTFLRIIL
jgi:hypothetical protein